MITDTLPYFLQLIKQNILLHSIVTCSGFSNMDLKEIEHKIITNNSIEFTQFELGPDERFESVLFYITNDSLSSGRNMTLSFITKESKYFENSKFYFNDYDNKLINQHPIIKLKRQKRKDIGFVQIFDLPIPPGEISISKNSNYGFAINIEFYSTYLEVQKNKKELEKAILESITPKENKNLRAF